MPLILSDPETGRLARSLATLTGESVEQAVGRALRDRLARERASQRAPSKADAGGPGQEADVRLLDDVHAIARRFREHAGGSFSSLDHGELLYDEAGLPR